MHFMLLGGGADYFCVVFGHISKKLLEDGNRIVVNRLKDLRETVREVTESFIVEVFDRVLDDFSDFFLILLCGF